MLNSQPPGFQVATHECLMIYPIKGQILALYMFQDDVISVADLDKLMPYGLGVRYAFLGALETSYLNANGILLYM